MRRRLLAASIALTLVMLVALEVPLALTYEQREQEQLEAALQRDAFFLASYVEDGLERGDPIDLQAVADGYQNDSGARVVIVDDAGILQADSAPTGADGRSFLSRPEIAEALDQRVAIGTRTSDTLGTDLLYVAVPVTSGGTVHGAVRISYSTEQLEGRVRGYWALLATIGAVSLVAATATGWVLARWVVRPLGELGRTSDAFGTGDLDVRAPTDSGPPEVRTLATTFNRMAGRIEDLVRAQDQFVADASHQLRTPLTALRLRLEMLETDLDEGTGDSARDDLDAAGTEVQRLARLVDGLLALTRAGRADPEVEVESMPLDQIVEDRVAAWAPVAADYGVQLEGRPCGLSVLGTPDRLSQVLDNLFANAIEHSSSGMVVSATACPASDPGLVELHVTDHGPGLDADQRDRAFDRFWRKDQRRTELGGSGLGLSIVQKLVEADGGWVTLGETDGGGLDVVVTLRGCDGT